MEATAAVSWVGSGITTCAAAAGPAAAAAIAPLLAPPLPATLLVDRLARQWIGEHGQTHHPGQGAAQRAAPGLDRVEKPGNRVEAPLVHLAPPPQFVARSSVRILAEMARIAHMSNAEDAIKVSSRAQALGVKIAGVN